MSDRDISIEGLAFGPVPSRRLGQSLGINNIPPKICTYSCVYCQVGRTLNMQSKRKEFYTSGDLVHAVEEKIKEARDKGESIDYLTFVPDGEPTLDRNLGIEIDRLKSTGIPLAVITNSSLIWRKDVREDLNKADWVSVKIDAVSQHAWHKINRPMGSLNLDYILHGISEFAHSYKGDLVTETMLIKDFNESLDEIELISEFIAKIKPHKSYIAIPTRPPAEKSVEAPPEGIVNRSYQIFCEKMIPTEYLIGYEGDAFAFTGNIEEDLLSITSVHPMRQDAVQKLLEKAEAGWDVVEDLIERKKLIEVEYKKRKFYVKKWQYAH
jgi:wyosine [tRNA(Phe)-imidazoG37] synthetase (radical SAM superfamily)